MFIKKLCLLFAALTISASGMAIETNNENLPVQSEANCLSVKDHAINFCKAAKVVITDKKGHVIYYNEGVKILDLSEWRDGSYIAIVDDKETFEFTL